jgi:predicted transposase YbfD/YdcC
MSDQPPRGSAPASIATHFADLQDPRVARTRRHELLEVVTIAILSVICGADSWDQMEVFAVARLPWLQTFLRLEHGAPSDDTFRRVFSALDPEAFARCFGSWMRSIAGSLVGKQLAVDGKTLRGSFDTEAGLAPIHMVHAWVAENSVLLGQLVTDAKSNEITTIPRLLALLELRDVLVTVDAMGCQTGIASTIVEGKGDYLLALKDNQPTTHKEVSSYFDHAIGASDVRSVEQIDKGHGRIETRRIHVTEDIGWFEDRKRWRGLKTFVAIERERIVDDKATYERAEFLCSLPASAIERIARAARAHWSVENQLHWSLDMTFGEDASRIRDRNGASNFALLRRLALVLLRGEKTVRESGPSKRLRAALDPNYLLRVLETAARSKSAGN